MNFSFRFNSSKQKEHIDDSSKVLSEAVESYKKAIQESVAQYNEHRKKAEEQIDRGARLTKHRINL
jgi:gas vesicle protein